MDSSSVIDNYVASKEQKLEARVAVRNLFGSLGIRCIFIGFIHLKTSMLQPLIMSFFMGMFSLIENEDTANVIRPYFPVIFKVMRKSD